MFPLSSLLLLRLLGCTSVPPPSRTTSAFRAGKAGAKGPSFTLRRTAPGRPSPSYCTIYDCRHSNNSPSIRGTKFQYQTSAQSLLSVQQGVQCTTGLLGPEISPPRDLPSSRPRRGSQKRRRHSFAKGLPLLRLLFRLRHSSVGPGGPEHRHILLTPDIVEGIEGLPRTKDRGRRQRPRTPFC